MRVEMAKFRFQENWLYDGYLIGFENKTHSNSASYWLFNKNA